MGPLTGTRIIEIKGIGPGPYAGMLLADMGADVIVVERDESAGVALLPFQLDINSRGKRRVTLDLKTPQGLASLLRLVDGADGLFEGYRPGVAERLGFGPDICLERNPALVYGRITGWGQDGPLAHTAGHDINYIALAGALAAIGGENKPELPLNLVGDYAGGSLFLVMGMLAAIIAARASGKGQVVDAAITDGTASLMSLFYTLHSLGQWQTSRASNLLDGGAPFYTVYATKDKRFMAVGAIEPKFFQELLTGLNLDAKDFGAQQDKRQWPKQKKILAEAFGREPSDHWCEVFEGSDACVSPVCDFQEAMQHPHNLARETHMQTNGVMQPAPAPRFSRTPSAIKEMPAVAEEGEIDWLPVRDNEPNTDI